MTSATIDASFAEIQEQTFTYLQQMPSDQRDFFGPLSRVLGKFGSAEAIAEAIQQMAASGQISVEWHIDEGLMIAMPGHEECDEYRLDPSEVAVAILEWFRKWDLHRSKRTADETQLLEILKSQAFAGSVRARDLMPALAHSDWTRGRTKAAMRLLVDRGLISFQTHGSGELFISLDGSLFQEPRFDLVEEFCSVEALWSLVAYPHASSDASRDGRVWNGLTERQAELLAKTLQERDWIVAAIDCEQI